MKKVLGMMFIIMALSSTTFAEEKVDMFHLSDFLGKPLGLITGCVSGFKEEDGVHHCYMYRHQDKILHGGILSVILKDGMIDSISSSYLHKTSSLSRNEVRMKTFMGVANLACGSYVKERKRDLSLMYIHDCGKYHIGLSMNTDMITIGFVSP